MRQIPDIAFDASPATGVNFINYGDLITGVGGTSLSAPIATAMWARLNATVGGLGFANNMIYGVLPDSVFHDVTSGNNGAYDAGAGYDRVTGQAWTWAPSSRSSCRPNKPYSFRRQRGAQPGDVFERRSVFLLRRSGCARSPHLNAVQRVNIQVARASDATGWHVFPETGTGESPGSVKGRDVPAR